MSTQSVIIQKVLKSADALAQNATEYSDSIPMKGMEGDVAVVIISTAGSITVTQQVSLDDSTWYDPVNSSGSAVGAVAAALTVTTGTYIVYSPVLAPYMRFKIVEGNVAATVVTLKVIARVALRG